MYNEETNERKGAKIKYTEGGQVWVEVQRGVVFDVEEVADGNNITLLGVQVNGAVHAAILVAAAEALIDHIYSDFPGMPISKIANDIAEATKNNIIKIIAEREAEKNGTR